MPSWGQIQQQLKNPENPVVFFDITVGQNVSIYFICFRYKFFWVNFVAVASQFPYSVCLSSNASNTFSQTSQQPNFWCDSRST